MHRIVLIGPPASGKGTQCRRIQELLGVETLGTGALLRREVDSGSDLGKEVESYLNCGAYVPDSLILSLVKNWLSERTNSGWLLDGFPRTIAQAEALESGADSDSPTLAIALNVSQDDLESRILNRRECADCGATVTVGTTGDESCQYCNGKLEQRSDDNLENFRTRYANYSELTQPLFDYYLAQGKLLSVDGSLTPDEVFAVISEHLTTK